MGALSNGSKGEEGLECCFFFLVEHVTHAVYAESCDAHAAVFVRSSLFWG